MVSFLPHKRLSLHLTTTQSSGSAISRTSSSGQNKTSTAMADDIRQENNHSPLSPLDDTNTTGDNLPNVPIGWEVRFDPVLGEYYYLNQIHNLIQLDHPEEVLSPISRHASVDSIFTKNRSSSSWKSAQDENHNISKYGDKEVRNEYREKLLLTHFLLANGTGIPNTNDESQQQRKKSLLKKRFSVFTRAQRDRANNDTSKITPSFDLDSVSSLSLEEESDVDDYDDKNNEELAILRRKMLMEVQHGEMNKMMMI